MIAGLVRIFIIKTDVARGVTPCLGGAVTDVSIDRMLSSSRVTRQTTRCYIPWDLKLEQHRCENLQYGVAVLVLTTLYTSEKHNRIVWVVVLTKVVTFVDVWRCSENLLALSSGRKGSNWRGQFRTKRRHASNKHRVSTLDTKVEHKHIHTLWCI